jgi:hypothetical protein
VEARELLAKLVREPMTQKLHARAMAILAAIPEPPDAGEWERFTERVTDPKERDSAILYAVQITYHPATVENPLAKEAEYLKEHFPEEWKAAHALLPSTYK